jgi:hypothetical protein
LALARLTGREDQPAERGWLALLGASLFFAVLAVLIIIYWPDSGAFIYEGV